MPGNASRSVADAVLMLTGAAGPDAPGRGRTAPATSTMSVAGDGDGEADAPANGVAPGPGDVAARTSTGRGSDRVYQSPAPASETIMIAARATSSPRESI